MLDKDGKGSNFRTASAVVGQIDSSSLFPPPPILPPRTRPRPRPRLFPSGCLRPHLHALRACSYHHLHLISVLGARHKLSSSCSFHHHLHVSGFSCTDGSHHTSRSHRRPFRSRSPQIVAHRRGNLSCSCPASRFCSVTRRCRSPRTDLSGFKEYERTGSRQVCFCLTSGMVWRRRRGGRGDRVCQVVLGECGGQLRPVR